MNGVQSGWNPAVVRPMSYGSIRLETRTGVMLLWLWAVLFTTASNRAGVAEIKVQLVCAIGERGTWFSKRYLCGMLGAECSLDTGIPHLSSTSGLLCTFEG